jgi:uncharacterized protein YjbI with pentapeptide repeats
MNLLDLSHDVLRQIMIHYIDNSEINKIKVNFIGSNILNEVCKIIQLDKFPLCDTLIKCDSCATTNFDKNGLIGLAIEKCDYVDINGNTTLMNGLNNAMSQIINYQKQFNTKDDISRRSAHILIAILCCKILHDCKLGQVNIDGNTALLLACKFKKSHFALKILDGASNPNQINIHGETALMLAEQNSMIDVVAKIKRIINQT